MLHMMIDLETWDTRVTASIRSMGAVLFEPREQGYAQSTFYRNVLDQPDRTRSQSTEKWWARQGDAAQAKFSDPEPVHIQTALKDLRDYFQGAKYVWSHGAGFDVAMLEHAYEGCGVRPPWNYQNVRDTRTLFMVADGYKMSGERGVAHYALDDAKAQARAVQECYVRLGKM